MTIFISHSSVNNAEALALRNWMVAQGWDKFFLDIDPKRGIVAGKRWLRALQDAGERASAVVFLVSKAWLGSEYCRAELFEATRIERPLFGLIIDDTTVGDVPTEMSANWQLTNLTQGSRFEPFEVLPPPYNDKKTVQFSAEGLEFLRNGLIAAGLTSIDTISFPWPPAGDEDRAPYRGLVALDRDDAGIFFGRDAELVRAIDQLAALREDGGRRLMVIQGASGAGKSSFLRAGLAPRLARDPRSWLVLDPIRPERATISGSAGLVATLDAAGRALKQPLTRAELAAAIETGTGGLAARLAELQDAAAAAFPDLPEDVADKAPTLILPIDQAEELFAADAGEEARRFVAMLGELLPNGPEMIALATIRTDAYPPLQNVPALKDLQVTAPLPVMGRDGHRAAIEGPARRVTDAGRPLTISPGLVTKLLDGAEGRDALPLLAFTLEQLYVEHGGDGRLTEADFKAFGGAKAAIAKAAADALADPHARPATATTLALPAIPADEAEQRRLLRRAFIPWLVSLNEANDAPLRRVARRAEIPQEALPLVERLIFPARLLRTDVNKAGEPTIEIAHEALLRQWPILQEWLAEEADTLRAVQGVERAAGEWARGARAKVWLVHGGRRLGEARRLAAREDLKSRFSQEMRDYLAACARHQRSRWANAIAASIAVFALAGAGVWRQDDIARLAFYQLPAKGDGFLRSAEPGAEFADCWARFTACPTMVVLPQGAFVMGSPSTEDGRYYSESPQHEVRIAYPLAVSKYEVTFDDWQACVDGGGCSANSTPADEGWGRGARPVINVTWHDAQTYVEWLSSVTGETYRLLSEAEWEYAARGVTSANDSGNGERYGWGVDAPVCDTDAPNGANFIDCDLGRTREVGSYRPNDFGLFDMHGNVWEWVEDPSHDTYEGAPDDGSAWTVDGDTSRRVLRGGSWRNDAENLRSADRFRIGAANPDIDWGFRVARTVLPE